MYMEISGVCVIPCIYSHNSHEENPVTDMLLYHWRVYGHQIANTVFTE